MFVDQQANAHVIVKENVPLNNVVVKKQEFFVRINVILK